MINQTFKINHVIDLDWSLAGIFRENFRAEFGRFRNMPTNICLTDRSGQFPGQEHHSIKNFKNKPFIFYRAYLDKSIPLQSARLLGTPGIGKTCFGLVLIKLFLDQNITFVYDAMTYCQPINPILIRNGKIQTLDLNSRDIFKILRSEKLFYIVDGKPPILPISALKNVSTILICSPRTEYFKKLGSYLNKINIKNWLSHEINSFLTLFLLI